MPDARSAIEVASAAAGRLPHDVPPHALANWITDAETGRGHLLARVIVNRLWQHHFGRGIVATPSDFGAQGERADASRAARLAGRRADPRRLAAQADPQAHHDERRLHAGRRGAIERTPPLDPDNTLVWRQPVAAPARGRGDPRRDARRRRHARRDDVRPRHARREPAAPEHLLHGQAQPAHPDAGPLRRPRRAPGPRRRPADHDDRPAGAAC